jgi:uncharacterized membrane protein (DUF373 family)
MPPSRPDPVVLRRSRAVRYPAQKRRPAGRGSKELLLYTAASDPITAQDGERTMLEKIDRFERLIYYILIVLLAVVILSAVIELIFILITGFLDVSAFRLDNHEILEIFGFFLLILIGIELLETIKTYLQENRIHVEIIVLLAIIAVARKVILLDPFGEGVSDLPLIGLGVIIFALCGGYYLIKKAGPED